MRASAWLLALACCAPAATPAKQWTVRDFAARGLDVGGFRSDRLLVPAGAAIPWRGPPFEATALTQGPGAGLVVQPAFSAGAVAAYVVAGAWVDHPTPWVQPVYKAVTRFDPVDPESRELSGSVSIFSVDVSGAFYSPFWREWFAVVPADTDPKTLTSVAALLAVATEVHPGATALYPFTPDGVGLAHPEGAEPSRPLSGEPIAKLQWEQGSVEGSPVFFPDFSGDRLHATEYALPIEQSLYVFVSADASGKTVDAQLPAVLPDDATHQSYLRRREVPLTPAMAIFVPVGADALRASFQGLGAKVPDVDPAIPAAVQRAYALRVASDASCFGDALVFPSGCVFLDSQARLEGAVPESGRLDTQTLVAVGALGLGP